MASSSVLGIVLGTHVPHRATLSIVRHQGGRCTPLVLVNRPCPSKSPEPRVRSVAPPRAIGVDVDLMPYMPGKTLPVLRRRPQVLPKIRRRTARRRPRFGHEASEEVAWRTPSNGAFFMIEVFAIGASDARFT